MVRPHGFDHFCDSLKGLEEHYVIIGGGAASKEATGGEEIALTGMPAKDISDAIGKLGKLPEAQFKQVMEKTPAKITDVMPALQKVFLPMGGQ